MNSYSVLNLCYTSVCCMIPYKFKGTAMPTNGILAQLAVPVYTYWHTCPLMCRVAIISLKNFFLV